MQEISGPAPLLSSLHTGFLAIGVEDTGNYASAEPANNYRRSATLSLDLQSVGSMLRAPLLPPAHGMKLISSITIYKPPHIGCRIPRKSNVTSVYGILSIRHN